MTHVKKQNLTSGTDSSLKPLTDIFWGHPVYQKRYVLKWNQFEPHLPQKMGRDASSPTPSSLNAEE